MNSPTQLPPEDQLARINESYLICEKLLGWHKCLPDSKGWRNGFDWEESEDTPDFSSWGQAGLILDEMAARGYSPKVGVAVPGKWYGVNPLGEASYAATGPLAIRAAALEYIKVLQS